MFHLPTGTPEKYDNCITRESSGYQYHVLSFLREGDHSKDSAYTVVCDPARDQIFAYMPPRNATTKEEFARDYMEGEEVEVTRAIEGTMITFFWNEHIAEWDICTRNGVGGNYSFVKPVKSLFVKDRPAAFVEDRPAAFVEDRPAAFVEDEYVITPKTYREMVLDVFRTRQANEQCNNNTDELELGNNPDFQGLLKNCFYTCILQHWENHLVYKQSQYCGARLRLISVYHSCYEMKCCYEMKYCDEDSTLTVCVSQNQRFTPTTTLANVMNELDSPKTTYEFEPRRYVPTVKELLPNEYGDIWNDARVVFEGQTNAEGQSSINSFTINSIDGWFDDDISVLKTGEHFPITDAELKNPESKFYPPAWILKNKRTGQTTEVANPHYQRAKNLRNMQPNLRYQWLELRRTRQVVAYVRTFEMYRGHFEHFEREYEAFVRNVFRTYFEHYVVKRKEHKPKKYFVHAAGIHHNIYLPSVFSGQKREITLQEVNQYFDVMSAGKLYYYITAN